MPVTPIIDSTALGQVKDASLPAAVLCFAPWCSASQLMQHRFAMWAEKYTDDGHFYKIDAEASEALAAEIGADGFPCVVGFADGREVYRRCGTVHESMEAELVAKVFRAA